MFFKKLFGKDSRYYLEKGKKCMVEERYADARHLFHEAMERLNREGNDSGAVRSEIAGYLQETGNRLGLLNIAEAEHAAARGDFAKAEEHLQLTLEFAQDQPVREKAERLLSSLRDSAAPVQPQQSQAHHSCSGCGTHPVAAVEDVHLADDHLSEQERFELLVHPLPGDLPQRYAALGDEFVRGYLLVQDGKAQEGGKIFQELLTRGENDILLYEIALINHRNGHLVESEKQLRHAIAVNDTNPLCHLALVQLLADSGRLEECIPLLEHMIDHQMLIEQAMLYLGDIYQGLGREDDAIQTYSTALGNPSAAKGAAERLVVIFQRQDRLEEAAFLAKRYLKGCC